MGDLCSQISVNNPCKSFPDAGCVVYTGIPLPYVGASTNDRLSVILYALNTKLSNVHGLGTVESVGLALPDIFTVSNSPVTVMGTLTGTFKTQNALKVFAGPISGADATPTFRFLVSDDIPLLDMAKISTGTLPYSRLTGTPDLSVYALKSITITSSGNGITGGGDLTANRNFALDFGYLDGRYQAAGYYYTQTEIQNFFTGTTPITGYNKNGWDAAYAAIISALTTSGSSGAATLTGGILNVPNYTLAGLQGVPTSRTITINGTTYDLSADRTWTISSSLPSQIGHSGEYLTTDGTNPSWATISATMVYPSAGIAISTGTAWATSITDNSSNWNTAYSWGNHALAGYFLASNFNSSFDTRLALKSTTDLSEGTNLYYTDARVRLAISLTTVGSSGAATYNNLTGAFNIPDYSSGLIGFVPYTGATGNVNLGEWGLSQSGFIQFDITPSYTTSAEGKLVWNTTDGTLDLGLKGGNVVLQIGQEFVVRVVNKTGINLTQADYQAVRISGAQGQRLKVDLAEGNNELNSKNAIAVVTENISNNQEGFTTTSGLVREINTTGSLQGETWVDGDILYLSPTVLGGLTNIEPTAPNHRVMMGYVVYSHAVHGSIYVKVDTGYELAELHDVLIPTPVNGDGLFYETSSGLWKSKSIVTILGYTPATAARNLTINGTTYDLTADRSWSVGTVTSVAALTLGTTGTDLSSSIATGSTTPVITLNVPTASSSNRGALSSADWITFNAKQPAGNYITALTGEATASGPGSVAITLDNTAVISKVLTGLNLGTGGTISATDNILGAFGKIQNQLSAMLGGVIYKGVWNATTNSPTIVSSTGTQGWYYVVNVAGSTSIDGISDWKIGDWIIFNGTTWDKVDNTDAVSSVNGFTGAVSLTTANIPEVTNLYYLDSRARAAISLTVLGNSGASTYSNITGIINIPTYTLDGLSPMTTAGDMIYGGALGTATRLAIGGANTVLHGGASAPSWSAVVEADISLSNNTTNNATTSRHGFLPILPNNATLYLNGQGNFTTPSGLSINNSYSQTAFSGTTVTIVHNWGAYPIVQVVDNTGAVIIPMSIVNNTLNDFTVTFSSSHTGTIIASLGGPQPQAVSVVTSNYAVLTTDRIVKVTTVGITVTLPTAVGNTGREFYINNATSGNIFLTGTSSQTISGQLIQVIPIGSTLQVYSDGVNYFII